MRAYRERQRACVDSSSLVSSEIRKQAVLVDPPLSGRPPARVDSLMFLSAVFAPESWLAKLSVQCHWRWAPIMRRHRRDGRTQLRFPRRLQRFCNGPAEIGGKTAKLLLSILNNLRPHEPPPNPVKCFEVLPAISSAVAPWRRRAAAPRTRRGNSDCSGFCSDTTSKSGPKEGTRYISTWMAESPQSNDFAILNWPTSMV